MNSQPSSLLDNTLRAAAFRTPESPRERKSLLETPLWNTPFQLLPRMAYPGKDLEKSLKWQHDFAMTLPNRPRFIIASVISENNTADLWSLFSSIAAQSYPDVQLVLGATSASVRDEVRPLFEEYKLPGEVFLFRTSTEEKSSTFFDHVRSFLTGPDSFAILLQPSAILHPSAAFIVAKQILKRNPDVLYTNEVILSDDLTTAQGYLRRSPLDKYSLLSQNTLGDMVVISPRATSYLAESEEAFMSSQTGLRMWSIATQLVTRDLRRAFIPLGLLHSRKEDLNPKQSAQLLSDEQGPLADQLFQYALRMGIPLKEVSFATHPVNGMYGLPTPGTAEGEIQVIIPYRNQSATTIQCLQSLSKQEDAASLHITLVNNGSDLAESEAVEEAAREFGFAEVTHITDGGYFNYARLNNLGSLQGDEPYILFLNNDVELTSPTTLSALRNWCSIEDVGAVGGLLRYPNGNIQHAGINFLSVRPANVSEDWQLNYLTREVNAVTFAMALVKRAALRAAGGLDEFLCPNGFGDALFCLELRKKGYRSIFTPQAEGTHHESLSRGRTPEELELLEMTQSGLPITDLYADFYAELQPMRVDFTQVNSSDFDRVVGRIKRSPRLVGTMNSLCKLLLWPVRLFRKI